MKGHCDRAVISAPKSHGLLLGKIELVNSLAPTAKLYSSTLNLTKNLSVQGISKTCMMTSSLPGK
jgi:hypothetical protein